MPLVCPACGDTNRVPDDHYRNEPECTRCSALLMSPEPVNQTDAELSKFIACTDLPVVVYFWTDWCGPCKAMAPIFVDAAKQIPVVRFVKVDSDSAQAASARYSIRRIPTLILSKSGIEIAQVSGSLHTGQLVSWIQRQLHA